MSPDDPIRYSVPEFLNMPELTFDEFLTECKEARKRNPEWRWGQVIYNELYDARPELAMKIRAAGNPNPFYKDSNTDAALDWIAERWAK